MQDSAKYLIHADITVDGVVERSDVVGAVFGQTEGLLGDELDLRDLQSSSKVGRIDVDVDSQNGQSFGRVTIATNLDRVETAILGASLETIERIGPCRSTVEIRRIEDAREAKRREIVDRAKTLLWEAFDDSMLSSQELVEEVRETIRIEDITEYRGLPAGPRVADGDAIILVEGRADVLTLLQYGIKNAIAVEGTNVPDAIADLTNDRTVTAFLDGDRGGELILKELAQVADLDHVAFAPEGRSVEDLGRREVMEGLRGKVPYERVASAEDPLIVSASGNQDTFQISDTDPSCGTDLPETPVATTVETDPDTESDGEHVSPADTERESASGVETDTPVKESSEIESTATEQATDEPSATEETSSIEEPATEGSSSTEQSSTDETSKAETSTEGRITSSSGPQTLRGHVSEIIDSDLDRVRLLDAEFREVAEDDATEAFDLLSETDPVPATVVIDGELSQRLLDLAAQRGVDQIVAEREGDFVKRPTSVRIRTASDLRTPTEA